MTSSTKQIAPWWHTIALSAVLIVVAIRGAMFQTSATDSTTLQRNVLALYISLFVLEAGLVYAVSRGISRSGTTLRDLVGGRWSSFADVATDVALAALTWRVIKGVAFLWDSLVGHDAAQSINPLLPRTSVEIIAWIAVSVAAGFAEEVVFRGYFQRQFTALTKNRYAALVLQALLFGVSHGYQGVSACAKITLLGMVFGGVALWRQSLRPGIIAHAWTDVASGVFGL